MTAVPVRHALVVADGDVASRSALDAAWPGWDDDVDLVIAADGGALRAAAIGLTVDRVVGDLDSLAPADVAAIEAAGIAIERASPDKDESDAELALLAALRTGARRVTMLGAFGGRRLDHALANLALLAHPALAGVAVVLLDGAARATLLRAPGADGRPLHHDLPGRVGDIVSLLPFGGAVTGITTSGLRYPLRDEALVLGPARGLSNVREAADAGVTVTDGLLLVVEHPASAS